MKAKKLLNAAPRRYLRDFEVRRMKARLERDGLPRVEMTVIVALTAGIGFLASYGLLRSGVESMGLRYPLALLVAYVFFLFLLWLWLKKEDLDIVLPDSGSGGSGCTGSRSGASADPVDLPDGFDFDLGDLMVPVMVLLLVVALALSSLWVIYTAPVLFAELLVDAVIAARLYKRLDGIEDRHWLQSAVRRTAWPLAATALAFFAAGLAMDVAVPEASSIGGVLASLGY